jgi:hypothetical protein
MARLPLVGEMNPPIMFNKVDLPHPDGPTTQMNSPSQISRLMFSRTGVFFPSRSNAILTLRSRNLALRDEAEKIAYAATLFLPITPADEL